VFGKRSGSDTDTRAPKPAAALEQASGVAALRDSAPATVSSPPLAPAKTAPPAPSIEARRSDTYYQVKATIFGALIEAIDLAQLASSTAKSAREEIRDIVNEIIAIKNIVMSIAEQEELLDDICQRRARLRPARTAAVARRYLRHHGQRRRHGVHRSRRPHPAHRHPLPADNQQLLNICQRIVSQVGRRVDESSPICDARLADGSRVNAIVPPLAIDGPALTIRKFKKDKLTLDQLVKFGAITPEGATILQIIGRCRANVLISGGTGSGKTTLLNCMTNYIDHDERVITLRGRRRTSNCSSPTWSAWKPVRPTSRARARSPCASWCATACACAPNASSSAKSADPKHSTCCKP